MILTLLKMQNYIGGGQDRDKITDLAGNLYNKTVLFFGSDVVQNLFFIYLFSIWSNFFNNSCVLNFFIRKNSNIFKYALRRLFKSVSVGFFFF